MSLRTDPKVCAPGKETLLERQRQYRTAALRAKQAGDLEQAKTHIKSSKVTGTHLSFGIPVSLPTCLSVHLSLIVFLSSCCSVYFYTVFVHDCLSFCLSCS